MKEVVKKTWSDLTVVATGFEETLEEHLRGRSHDEEDSRWSVGVGRRSRVVPSSSWKSRRSMDTLSSVRRCVGGFRRF